MSEYVPDRWRHECRTKHPQILVWCDHRAGHPGDHQGMGVGPYAGLHRWPPRIEDDTDKKAEA